MTNNIHTRALLVSLRISAWTARKYDRKISDQVAAEHGASADAGRYNKCLIPSDAESYKNLVRACTSARETCYSQTLAWSDEGWRLLPTDNYFHFTEFIRKAKQEFETNLAIFLVDYPDLRDGARARLNGMFRAEDYPSTDDIARRFSFSVEFAPLPAAGDFRVTLSDAELQALESGTAQRIKGAVSDATRDAWKRLYDCVAHVQERLADPKAIFRDSLIGNAREICDVLTRLNITGDQQLETMRIAVQQSIASCDPGTLRDNSFHRAETARKAADLLAAMNGVYNGKI